MVAGAVVVRVRRVEGVLGGAAAPPAGAHGGDEDGVGERGALPFLADLGTDNGLAANDGDAGRLRPGLVLFDEVESLPDERPLVLERPRLLRYAWQKEDKGRQPKKRSRFAGAIRRGGGGGVGGISVAPDFVAEPLKSAPYWTIRCARKHRTQSYQKMLCDYFGGRIAKEQEGNQSPESARAFDSLKRM